jgi:serine/threonine-protein kinase
MGPPESDSIAPLNAALEGRYLVKRELGEGGMATVYLADDLKHERKVALKVLKPELAAVVGADRFLAEIKTTANLQHPHILPLFDSGEADGFLFYVMPFVEGESLHDRLERDYQLPVDEAVRLAVDLAEALESAHAHGVVHRDVKPANILLSQGRPLVADFGIALALSSAGGHRMTETGLSLGTPHYVSPEQATGDQVVGPASDIYSLGCVVYEMLVGEPPYTGRTAQAVLGRVITSVPESVASQRRAVPAHVDAAVSKALEKVPADRFSSAAEFAAALEDETFRHGAMGVTSASRQSRAFAAAGWVLLALFGIGFITTALQPDPAPVVRKLSLTYPPETGPSEWFDLTPDGSALIMADRSRGSGAAFSLFIQRLDDVSTVPIPDSRTGFDPAVSPDRCGPFGQAAARRAVFVGARMDSCTTGLMRATSTVFPSQVGSPSSFSRRVKMKDSDTFGRWATARVPCSMPTG